MGKLTWFCAEVANGQPAHLNDHQKLEKGKLKYKKMLLLLISANLIKKRFTGQTSSSGGTTK